MNFLIYGKRRQGKSTLALALSVTEHNRTVIFDPNGQFPLVESFDWDRLEKQLKIVPVADEIHLMRVGPFDSDEVGESFSVFSEILSYERNVSVVIDEAHMLQTSGGIHPELDRWNRRSPSNVAVIATTHRIVDAHPDTRYHADHVFFFYAYLEREIKTIRDNFGDVYKEVPGLKAYQVIHWRKEPGAIPRWDVWPDGQEWFIDLENGNI